MANSDRSIRRIAPLRNWRTAVALLVAVAAMGGAGYLFSQRHVFKVQVRPGKVAHVDVEVPMRQFGKAMSFAKERGLPVSCTVSRAGRDEAGVRVTVVQTSHTVHRLRAKLRIRADHDATPGTARRSIEFTIDGQDGWPTATLVVDVR